MAITRRQFIKRAGLVTAGGFLGPSLFSDPFIRKAVAQSIGDRYLVVLFLDGGNDGLNTVTPYDDGTAPLRQYYETHRNVGTGGIRLLQSQLTGTLIDHDPGTGSALAIHPGFRNATTGGMWRLYQEGKVAVIQGVGYPRPNLSHDQSRRKWETGDPLGTGLATGWLGRYMAINYGGLQIPAFCVRSSVAGSLVQSQTSVLSVTRLQNFGFPYDSFNGSTADRPLRNAAFSALYGEAMGSSQPLLKYTGEVGNSTFTATQSYPQLHTDYVADRKTWSDRYADAGGSLGTSTARNLREIAKVIYGVQRGAISDTRIFELRRGGYDTHSNQGGAAANTAHYNLHKEVSDAIELFYEDCADMGVHNKLCIMVWSEFSRRIKQNDNGTDHGSQGPVFVIGGTNAQGGRVNGGVYGKHPNIQPSSLDSAGNSVYRQGDSTVPYRSTDLRDVYGTILKRFLNMQHTQVQSVLPADSGNAADFWTVPNFDLPFLA